MGTVLITPVIEDLPLGNLSQKPIRLRYVSVLVGVFPVSCLQRQLQKKQKYRPYIMLTELSNVQVKYLLIMSDLSCRALELLVIKSVVILWKAL